jgi:hypothetical protein
MFKPAKLNFLQNTNVHDRMEIDAKYQLLVRIAPVNSILYGGTFIVIPNRPIMLNWHK